MKRKKYLTSERSIKNWPKDERPREKLLKFGEASGKGRSSRLQSAFEKE